MSRIAEASSQTDHTLWSTFADLFQFGVFVLGHLQVIKQVFANPIGCACARTIGFGCGVMWKGVVLCGVEWHRMEWRRVPLCGEG